MLGPNGSGKTTLLRLLAGLERPTSGEVSLDGRPASGLDLRTRRTIGYVTQRPALVSATVRRNIELPLAWRGVARDERRRRALAALSRLDVAGLAERPAGRLSGGERQRVSLARTLATEPTVLLLDEPAAALDPGARTALLDDLDTALAATGATVVHVSHRVEEAVRGAERVVVLDAGRVRQVGSPVEVLQAPADPVVARLVGYPNVLAAAADTGGQVRVGGTPVATCDLPAGPVAVAVWAGGVEVLDPVPVAGHDGADLLAGTVRSVTPGAGHWAVGIDVGIEAGTGVTAPVVSHLAPDRIPPAVGGRVRLRFRDEQLAVVPLAAPDGQD